MIHKDDTTPTDKICPIMSTNRIVFDGHFVKCRKECAWYELCNPQEKLRTSLPKDSEVTE